MNSKHLVCALACLQACIALAQDADAQARAKRDADNPLRMIVEASKIKARQKAAEAEPAAKPAAQAVAARPATSKPAIPIVAPQLALAGGPEPSLPAVVAAEAERPKPADPVLIEPAQPPAGTDAAPTTPTQETLPSPPPAASAPKTGPGSDAEPAPAGELALNAAQTPALAAAAPAPSEALQLADYVEPALPDRVRRRLQGDGEVVVQFTVNPDGSVADASVRSSSDRALDPIALDAVRQWRYRPIATMQAHAVQLVFRLRE